MCHEFAICDPRALKMSITVTKRALWVLKPHLQQLPSKSRSSRSQQLQPAAVHSAIFCPYVFSFLHRFIRFSQTSILHPELFHFYSSTSACKLWTGYSGCARCQLKAFAYSRLTIGWWWDTAEVRSEHVQQVGGFGGAEPESSKMHCFFVSCSGQNST